MVILGIALAVGLDTFKVNRRQAEIDRVTLDMSRIAHEIQVWKMQPAQLDGGENKDLSEITFDRIYHTTGPCDAMAGPLGAGETCYYQEQEIRYILQPVDENIKVIALSRDIGFAANQFRLAETVVSGVHPEDVSFTLIQ